MWCCHCLLDVFVAFIVAFSLHLMALGYLGKCFKVVLFQGVITVASFGMEFVGIST